MSEKKDQLPADVSERTRSLEGLSRLRPQPSGEASGTAGKDAAATPASTEKKQGSSS